MWRRAYLLFLLVRVYFAFCASYIHPDENFQGPEVIAGQVFGYSHHLTWEFTSEHPVRSVFPLWPVYGLPMLLLRWLWTETGNENVAPKAIYYSLRALMFGFSFVLEDWAVFELVFSSKQLYEPVVLVASSYVTWVYQTHTFSNSIETILVAWSLVLIQRILEDRRRISIFSHSILAILLVTGVFNRITFPAFVLIPLLRLIPHFVKRPSSLIHMIVVGTLVTLLAIYVDTVFYHPVNTPSLFTLIQHPSLVTLTPLNSLFYNTQTTNLAQHGLHPRYSHLLFNFPLLLGPALLLLPINPSFQCLTSLPLLSSISGILILSFIPHQEPRFLLPIIPLFLCMLHLPRPRRTRHLFLGVWLLFNAIFGVLMGAYHQAGVVPTQLFLSESSLTEAAPLRGGIHDVYWWKTYSPPHWLLGARGTDVTTHDLMGISGDELISILNEATKCTGGEDVLMVAPWSAEFLDQFTGAESVASAPEGMTFRKVWSYNRHLNLDDLDVEKDGLWRTMKRVIGRRGIVVWRVSRSCD